VKLADLLKQAGSLLTGGCAQVPGRVSEYLRGTLIIGMEDRPKQIRGLADVLDAEERLASLISDSIRPRLTPDIEIVPWRKLSVIVVRVYPGTRPRHLQRLGPVDGVFVRFGSTNRKAEASQIEELKGGG
jgi:ATP-dependent DNA helicase RecG